MHPYAIASSPGSSDSLPTVISSPQILSQATSSTVNKPLAPMPGMASQPPISIHKQWVLPPKPKPGRKPAVDTPPTKRKAQNREAQRAFRERRAAKVGELEEEMRRMEEEDRREQEELRGRIQHLESSVDEYSRLVTAWQEKYRQKEIDYDRERQSRHTAEREVDILRKGVIDGKDVVALPPRRPTQNGHVKDDGPKEQHATTFVTRADHTCGNCSEGYCKCIDDAFRTSEFISEDTTKTGFKRPHSPTSSINNKRSRQASDYDNGTEIDFTTQFATPQRPALTTNTSTSSVTAMTPPEPCGFCSNGGTCVCAELSKDKPQSEDLKPPSPILTRSSEAFANGFASSDPCVNGPGTCEQCLSNPKSTLFCKFVAANRSSATPANGSLPTPQAEPNGAPVPLLTCADAFTTLSRHPAFDQASNELGSWVPRLAPVRKPASRPNRTAYDIEAANVMSVLKYFDRRFGEDGKFVRGVDGVRDGKTELPDRDINGAGDGKGKSWIAYEPTSEP